MKVVAESLEARLGEPPPEQEPLRNEALFPCRECAHQTGVVVQAQVVSKPIKYHALSNRLWARMFEKISGRRRLRKPFKYQGLAFFPQGEMVALLPLDEVELYAVSRLFPMATEGREVGDLCTQAGLFLLKCWATQVFQRVRQVVHPRIPAQHEH